MLNGQMNLTLEDDRELWEVEDETTVALRWLPMTCVRPQCVPEFLLCSRVNCTKQKHKFHTFVSLKLNVFMRFF